MYALVIPSGSIDNLFACLAAVVTMEPAPKKVVIVGDGIDTTKISIPHAYIEGEKPFVFAQNCNVGMDCAFREYKDIDGVIILGDDGILMHPLGFTKLDRIARENPEFGIIAASTNNCGNHNQMWKSESDLRDEPEKVAFICVYIPRSTVEKIGFMDTRFVAYGYDDDDYCRRVLNAGLKIGVYDGCKINHFILPSVFRNKGINIEVNKKIYDDKWEKGGNG